QAEDGIRDFHVTGVQTCALPIYVATARLTALVRVTDPRRTQVRLQVASRADDGGETGFKAALVLQVRIDSRAQVLDLRLQRDHAGRVTLGLGVVVLGSPGCLDEAEDRGGVHRSDELGVIAPVRSPRLADGSGVGS